MSIERRMAPNDQPSGEPSTSQQPPQRRERFWDLKASHWVEVFLTIVLIVFAGLQYCVYTRQAGIMDQQTAIARAEHRPWISASAIELVGDLTHDDNGLNITVEFTMKNTGHSPAHRAFPAFIPTFPPWGDATRQKACDLADNKFLGIVIFPGDKAIQDIQSNIPETQFMALKEGTTQPTAIPVIVACIVYYDMESKKPHETPYVFRFIDPNNPSSVSSLLSIISRRGAIKSGAVVLRYVPVDASPD